MALERDTHATGMPLEWSRCNWWSNPLFRSLTESPSVSAIKHSIVSAPHEEDRLWAVRAAMFHVNIQGMREMLLKCFEAGLLPEDEVCLWPHANLRSRFIHDELSYVYAWQKEGVSHGNWLRALACCWPWIWKDDAAQQGMGESHPIARVVRSGYTAMLPALYSMLSPTDWLEWGAPGADRMVSFLLRRASVDELISLAAYDSRFLAWKHKKDGRNLLHEACMKLRMDVVSWLLAEGIDEQQEDRLGLLPAHYALKSALEDTRPRNASRQRIEHAAIKLRGVLDALGEKHGLMASSGSLFDMLRVDEMDRLRIIVEQAVLRSSSPIDQGAPPVSHRL